MGQDPPRPMSTDIPAYTSIMPMALSDVARINFRDGILGGRGSKAVKYTYFIKPAVIFILF